ncbi:hypothetical protein ACXJJ3_41975 (plasmid) [Kribbella sp. WER1]
MRRHDDIDLAELISRIPNELLHGGRPAGGARPDPNGSLSLTIAGAAVCSGTEQVLQVVVAAARLGEAAYRTGDPDHPAEVTFPQVLEDLGLDLPEAEKKNLGRQSSMLLNEERWWSHHGTTAEGGWTCTVTEDIRFYKGVTTFAAYWDARDRQLAAQQVPIPGGTWVPPAPYGAGPVAPHRAENPVAMPSDQAINVLVSGKHNRVHLNNTQAQHGDASSTTGAAGNDDDQVARQSLRWTKRQTLWTIVGVALAAAGMVITFLLS